MNWTAIDLWEEKKQRLLEARAAVFCTGGTGLADDDTVDVLRHAEDAVLAYPIDEGFEMAFEQLRVLMGRARTAGVAPSPEQWREMHVTAEWIAEHYRHVTDLLASATQALAERLCEIRSQAGEASRTPAAAWIISFLHEAAFAFPAGNALRDQLLGFVTAVAHTDRATVGMAVANTQSRRRPKVARPRNSASNARSRRKQTR